ncbi:MAG: phosphate ABC transporter substrate-binding protein [Spirochaetales bacterium]|nr:phosphate ABC transporter substrate-binding protein [Spirochaetales bacterium]
MKRIAFIFIIFSLAVVFTFGMPQKEKTSYNFGGSTTILPIIESAIEEFLKTHPGITISYEGQGSSVGINGVIEGTYSLGGSSRELKDSEIEKGVKATAIALDGIAVIVNGEVTIDNFSLEQVAKIFSGEISNWKDAGGPDQPIVIINRDEASGTRATFSELVLDKVFGKGGKFKADAIITESNGDMVTKAGSTPFAIGYCGFGYISRVRNAGGKAIAVNGIPPEVRYVVDGSYSISRKLYVVHKGDLKNGTIEKEFVDFLLSDEGQAIVEDEKFISLP